MDAAAARRRARFDRYVFARAATGPWTRAALFVVAMAALEALWFAVPFAGYVGDYWRLSQSLGQWFRFPAAVGAVVLSLVLAVAYIRFSLAAGWRVRAVAWAVFALIVGIEYGYLRVNHDFLRFNDIDTIFKSNLVVWWAAIAEFAEWRALVPVALFAALLVATPVPERARGGRALLALAVVTPIFFSALYSVSSGSFPTVALAAFGRDLTYSGWINASLYRGPRDVLPPTTPTPPAFNIVLVIDESVRPDHLSVNGYERQTTPTLDALAARGAVTTWHTAVSGSTTSVAANTLLLTGVTSMPDRAYGTKQHPTLFQYARAAGFHTIYFDGHTNLLWNLTPDDKRYVDEWININDLTYGLTSDFRIAQEVQRRARQGGGSFMVVNKRGVHAPYNDDFPEGEAAWTPVLPNHGFYDPSRPDLIRNSYDSAIRYNVDGFFARMIDDAVLANTYVFYTSDHGQTLSEGGESWTHGRHTKNEAAVPLLLVTGRERRPAAIRACAAHHANIVPTILDLMGVTYDQNKYAYAPSLVGAAPCASPARRYIWGDLYGHAAYSVEEFDRR
jgi:glucan phosphoethanolaminetransferase (alkaline phosphatase superfamily)